MSAGWFADPSNPQQQRYWDGRAWTAHVVAYTHPAPGYGAVAVPNPGYVVPHQGYPVNNQGYAIAAKNPALSLIVSFFLPGVGTMMNGEVGKGVGILIGYLVSIVLTVVIIGIFGVIGFFVWGLVDAYTGAQNWNRAHGIIS